MDSRYRFYPKMGIVLALMSMVLILAAPGTSVNVSKTVSPLITPQIAGEYVPLDTISIDNDG